VRQSTAFDS
jgi:hypothetical protein